VTFSGLPDRGILVKYSRSISLLWSGLYPRSFALRCHLYIIDFDLIIGKRAMIYLIGILIARYARA
jgi:hypothetical protein